jgi:hypothetical protein
LLLVWSVGTGLCRFRLRFSAPPAKPSPHCPVSPPSNSPLRVGTSPCSGTTRGQTYLDTQTVTGQDLHRVVSTDNRDYIITWFRWVNDERLLVSVRFAATRDAIDSIETRLMAVNRDGTEQTPNLFKQSSFPSIFGKKHFPQFQDRLVGTIPGDPRHVFLALDLERPNSPDVYNVDIYSGERTAGAKRIPALQPGPLE